MTALMTQNMNLLWSSLIIDELICQDVTQFYISPGLRNAPLLTTISSRSGSVSVNVVIDERSAAYQALGFAKNTGRAACLVCTSGTAMANYFPAIIEAWKSRIPLIVMSCDRPPELNEANANQTIEQRRLYGNYLRSELNFECSSESIEPRSLRTSVAHLVASAHFSSLGRGPVHLNIPFREPLDGSSDQSTDNRDSRINYIQRAQSTLGNKSTVYAETYPQVSTEAIQELVKKIQETPRTLFVIGELSAWTNKEAIIELAKKLKLPAYFDALSSLKYMFSILEDPTSHQAGPTPTFDHPEVFQRFSANPPELIVHLGGRLVSKHYYKFLQSHPQVELYTINDSTQKEDPSFQTTKRFVARPDVFAQSFLDYLNREKLNNFDFEFQHLDWSTFVAQKEAVIDNAPLCYPLISKSIIENIPDESTLYLGNSTVIRSFDSYAGRTVNKKIRVLGHRGASGIEGFISAATGAAKSETSSNPLTLIIGDVSALHDLNGLQALSQSEKPVVCLIANNQGGGIFSLLPMEQTDDVKSMMFSPHSCDFEAFAQGFNIPYRLIKKKEELVSSYMQAIEMAKETNCSQLLEVQFDNDTNTQIYQQLKTIKL